MRLVTSELVESREILPGQWLQSYHAPQIAASSRAGQFVHIRTGDYSGLVLRRPFSVNTADLATGIITIHFRTIGRGTRSTYWVRSAGRSKLILGRDACCSSPAASGWLVSATSPTRRSGTAAR